MKGICVSFVRNEADIIEVFVRYHAKLFDKIYIINHNSNDETQKILDSLAKEGLPLILRRESIAYHAQAECMTAAIHDVWDSYKPDFVMLLDADEFVVLRVPFSEIIGNTTVFAPWRNYVPTEHDDPEEHNVLRRIQHRNTKVNGNQHKVLIPGHLLKNPKVFVTEGNHELWEKPGVPVPYTLSDKIYLAHFPVRSAEQVRRKAFVGWPSKVANPMNGPIMPTWSHWKLFFDKFKSGWEPTLPELQRLAAGYTFDQKEFSLDLTHDPVVVPTGVEMKYPPEPYPALEALADVAELLAFNFSLTHHRGS